MKAHCLGLLITFAVLWPNEAHAGKKLSACWAYFKEHIGFHRKPIDEKTKAVSMLPQEAPLDYETPVGMPTTDELFSALEKTGWRPHRGAAPPESWSFDGPTSYDYGLDGALALAGVTKPATFINDFLEARRASHKSTHVLDLMGSGFFANNHIVDSKTGLRLGPYNRERLLADYPKFPKENIPTEVLGDIMVPATWTKLDESMKGRNIPKFDFIVMRPVEGWERASFAQTAEQNAIALSSVVLNAANRLSPDGQFIFELFTNRVEGDITQQQRLRDLVVAIHQNTPFKLILKPGSFDGQVSKNIYGALLPK